MATFKEMVDRREFLVKKIELVEELKTHLDKNLESRHDSKVVEEVYLDIDQLVLAPLNDELKKVDSSEVEYDGKKQGKRAKAKRKTSGAKGRSRRNQ